ncbi:hypothetical protein [Kosmotoga olearia]|uniref:Uncharacterized protein n=1 Tax=Kosmotoga olearia (strain ATCC BAA-1733 / DSM 21960 / TBF 19.5.1) TaxID=521045 RepID=C5CEI9_KOSOT|nr:hypothetical protein [Kosmotoga olearia]ACR79235.1 hypothetical protein Kole_0513 [Kosmotoga olearia TBF 19.5.1]
MKKIVVVMFFLLFCFCAFSASNDALQYRINITSELNKSYLKTIQGIINYNGLFKSGRDVFLEMLYSKDPLLARFQKETQEAVRKMQEARSRGASSEEILRLQLEYQEARLRENKQLTALIESNLYNSIDYLASETLKGSMKTAGKVIDDVLSNWKTILEPLLEGDFGGVVKNAILQLIDSTYKVTFIDYCKRNYGATEKIAQYWWKTYFVEPFETSEEKKLVDKVLTKASDDLKDKLKDRLTKRLELEILSKGGKLTKEAIEKTVKEKAESILKNIIETPSLLVELFTKYYNVVDFQIMFNDIAANEVVFIKKIRELVGDNEDEINKCYFDKAYFLSKIKALNKGKIQVQGKKEPSKKLAKSEEVIPAEVIVKAEETARTHDPLREVSTIQNIEDKIETLSELQVEEKIPSPDNAKQIIEYAFGQLENDEITLSAFTYEVNQVVSSYISQMNEAKAKIASALKMDYNKGLIDWNEYSEKVKSINEDVKQNLEELNTFISSKKQEIERNQKAFRQKLSQLIRSFNPGNEMKLIQDKLSTKIVEFLKLYKQKTGQYVSIYPYSSFSAMMKEFNEGFGQSFINQLTSKAPSLFLLQNGGWILENLLGICYEDEHLTGTLIEKVNSLSEKINALFDSVPEYYYTDRDGRIVYSRDLASIEAFKKSLLGRMKGTLDWKATVSQWAYMAELKNEKTKQYLEVYLAFLTQKVELFQNMLQIVVDGFNSLEPLYMEKWVSKIEQMAYTIRNMWEQKITPDEARNKLRKISQITKDVDSKYAYWLETRDVLEAIASDVYRIKSNGVAMLNFEPSKKYSDYINSLIVKNNQLKKRASQMIEEYEKASLFDYTHDLKTRVLDFVSKYRSYLGHGFCAQKAGISFPLGPDDPDIMGIVGGDLEKALNLCERYEQFLEMAEKREKAAKEADRVLDSYLDKIQAEVEAIEKAGGYTTSEKKEELIRLLAEAVEKATETFKSYGFEYSNWSSSRERNLRSRIENIRVLESNVGQSVGKTTNKFREIEKPEKITLGDLVWLNVMKDGYPSYRFRLSPDGKKLLIERNNNSGNSFSLYNIETGTLDEFPLSEPVKAILSKGYNFDWISEDKIYLYAYSGEGFEIDKSGSYKDRPVTTIKGMGLVLQGISPSGEYILARKLDGGIYVLKISDATIEKIGITYADKILQWVPGTDSVLFKDQNSKLNIYDVKSRTLKTYETTFEGYVCAILPGGKWIVYGNPFEVVAQNLNDSQKITLWKGEGGANILTGIYPLQGNTVLLVWMHHGESFDYGVQVCKIE